MWVVRKDFDVSWNFRQPQIYTYTFVYTVVCFICVCIYTHGLIHTWRGKLLLSLIMREAAAPTYVWIICLNTCGLTRPQIHTCLHKATGIYMHLHMHTYSNTFTTHTYCCIQILLFFYPCLSFKCFISICNFVVSI